MSGVVCGIYAIVNARTGERYVGQSIDIQRRIRQQFARLRAGRSHCPAMQAAFSRDPSAFRTEILELCPRATLDPAEQRHMDAAAAGSLYNRALVAGWPPAGWRLTAEENQRHSLARKAELATPDGKAAHAKAMAKRSTNTAWRENASSRGRSWRANAEFVSRHDAALERRSADPKWQEMMATRNREMAKRPGRKATLVAAFARPDVKAQRVAAKLAHYDRLRADPAAFAAHRKAISEGMKRARAARAQAAGRV